MTVEPHALRQAKRLLTFIVEHNGTPQSTALSECTSGSAATAFAQIPCKLITS
jgi:hypothetical protein